MWLACYQAKWTDLQLGAAHVHKRHAETRVACRLTSKTQFLSEQEALRRLVDIHNVKVCTQDMRTRIIVHVAAPQVGEWHTRVVLGAARAQTGGHT